jgi:hypothetical protein
MGVWPDQRRDLTARHLRNFHPWSSHSSIDDVARSRQNGSMSCL